MNRASNKKIETGSKIVIIGGGPAGCFFALYLLHYGRERGIKPEITIYEQRNFDAMGPKGCKGCAGVLSISLLRNLGEIGLSIPEEIIQNRIERYTVHTPYTSITISNPEKAIQIASIYRGGGPRKSDHGNLISFNGWLLRETQKHGVRVENQRVSRINLGRQAVVAVGGNELRCDLVVLASGVNTKPIPITGVDYVPPETQIMSLDELYVGTQQVESRIGNVAHVFLIPHSGLVFGTLVPKGPFISVSLLSKGEHPISVTDFLRHNLVRTVLPERCKHVCSCRPQAVVGPAQNYFADGFVVIGEAAMSRLYKDGIGSSLLTAREAARTAVYHGISRQDFEHHYQLFCRSIARDNGWGRLLFSINDKGKESYAFSCAQQRLIVGEHTSTRRPRPFTRAAWGMFTGSYSYRSIAQMTFSPASMAKLVVALSWESFRGLPRKGVANRKILYVGGRKKRMKQGY
jgi:flavin-dependent dehydrogenase